MVAFAEGRRRSVAEEALVRSLFDEHGRALLAYVTRLMGDRYAAEDVVQETLLRAWRNPDVLVNGKGSVRGWLFTVARNLVVDRARAVSARPAEVAEVPTAAAPGDHAETLVDSLAVMGALESLSGEHRDVLMELYFRESSVAEASLALGIPQGTVRSRCFYALRVLRDQLARSDDVEGATA